METFDDLINEEILNELGEVIGTIGDKFARKIGGMGDALKARLGSKHAKGRNNLRDYMHHLADQFKVYCGEQHISMGEAAVEDFLEFLRYRVNFNISDENFDRLAYGAIASQDAENRATIEQITDDLNDALHQQDAKTAATKIAVLARVASGNNADAMLARKSLWKAAREVPSAKQMFKPVQKYVGRPIKAKFAELCQKIAQVMIKIGDRGRHDTQNYRSRKRVQQIDSPEAKVDSENMTPGLVPIFSAGRVAASGVAYTPLLQQLDMYGLPTPLFVDLNRACRDGADATELNKLLRRIRPFSKNNCINLSRILIQCFRGRNIKTLQDHLYPKYDSDKNLPRVIDRIVRQAPIESDESDESGAPIMVYDGDEANRMLMQAVTDEATAEKLLLLLIGCFGRFR